MHEGSASPMGERPWRLSPSVVSLVSSPLSSSSSPPQAAAKMASPMRRAESRSHRRWCRIDFLPVEESSEGGNPRCGPQVYHSAGVPTLPSAAVCVKERSRCPVRRGQARSTLLHELRSVLERLGRVVVAFSGGADSAFLAWVATDTLGAERALAVTAVSPSLAGDERRRLRRLAAEWGLRWREVETDELGRAAYTRNDGDRCYWCKDELMTPSSRSLAAEGGDRRARGERRRPRRPSAGAAGRGRAGRGLPAGRGRLHQGRRAGRGRGAWACARGTSRPPPAWRRACPTARR